MVQGNNPLIVIGDTLGGKEEINVECIELNDSALVLFIQRNNVEEAIAVINLAIECDSENLNFVRNKLVFLLNGEHYGECLKYLQEKKNVIRSLEYYSGTADCNYYLKNREQFDYFSNLALKEAERIFDQKRDQTNLITFLTIVKRYEGESEAYGILEKNRSVLDDGEKIKMYEVVVDMLKKTPTITDTVTPLQMKK
jgi:hypothetical protein